MSLGGEKRLAKTNSTHSISLWASYFSWWDWHFSPWSPAELEARFAPGRILGTGFDLSQGQTGRLPALLTHPDQSLRACRAGRRAFSKSSEDGASKMDCEVCSEPCSHYQLTLLPPGEELTIPLQGLTFSHLQKLLPVGRVPQTVRFPP